MTDLDVNEMVWLLGLAAHVRREKERGLRQLEAKTVTPRERFFQMRQSRMRAIEWALSVEDHLVMLIGAIDPEQLRRPEHRARYRELQAA